MTKRLAQIVAVFLSVLIAGTAVAWGPHTEITRARQHLIEFGPPGAWDHSMVVARRVEVGDEWWIYYPGFDGAHDDPKGRKGAIGLAMVRKEGVVSQHGPKTGGVVCTRALRWPGGSLLINADDHAGKLQIRVSDELRKPIKGFNYDDAPAFTGDSVAHEVQWNGMSLDELKGQVIRPEFQLDDADLDTFRANQN